MLRVHNTRATAVTLELGDGAAFTYSLAAGAAVDFPAAVRFESTDYRAGPLFRDSLIIGEAAANPPLLFTPAYDPAAFVVMAVFVLLGSYLSVVTIKGAF